MNGRSQGTWIISYANMEDHAFGFEGQERRNGAPIWHFLGRMKHLVVSYQNHIPS